MPKQEKIFDLMAYMKVKAILGETLLPQQLPALFLAGGWTYIFHDMNKAVEKLIIEIEPYDKSNEYIPAIKKIRDYYINRKRINSKYLKMKDPTSANLCFAGNIYLMTAKMFRVLNCYLNGLTPED
jgi:hypothetical protein